MAAKPESPQRGLEGQKLVTWLFRLWSWVTQVWTVATGGTGLSTVAQGDLLYGSATDTLARLAKDANATRYVANTGTSNNPAWAQVNLANGVTGALPIANGGTGAALTDPNADRILFWDDSAGAVDWLTAGTGLTLTGTTLTATGAGRTISANTTQTGNVGIGEDELHAHTITAALGANNNERIIIKASGTFSGSLNNKRLRARFIENANDNLVFDSGSLAISAATDWELDGTIIRTAATTFKATFNLQTSSATLASYSDYFNGTYTFANAGTLKLTGEATADNDVVAEFSVVDWRAAP